MNLHDQSEVIATIQAVIRFDSLPIEVIRIIFVLCLPEDFHKVLQPDKSNAPILLCHVCRRWRQIAFDTPPLWSKLHARITILTFLKRVKGVLFDWERFIAPKSQDFFNWWAANRKLESQPFTLSFGQPWERRGFHHSDRYELETTFHAGDIATDTYAAFLSGPLVTSAQSLDLSLLEDDFRMLCVTSFSEFKNLEYLTLHTLMDTIIRYPEWHYFPSAPRLRRLHLSSSNLLKILPGAQLTHLCISGVTGPNALHQILTVSCPNLLSGAFSMGSIAFDDDQPTPRVSNQHLRQLVLYGPGYVNAAFVAFFTQLSFQSLSSLRLLTDWGIRDDPDIFALLLMFQEATPNIIELHLGANFFCEPYGTKGIYYDSKVGHRSLGETLPKLKILVLEMVDTVVENNRDYFKGLVQSSFFRPSPEIQSTRVEIVFEMPKRTFSSLTQPSTTGIFGSQVHDQDPQNVPIVQRMNNSAEESLYVQLQAYINDHRQTLHHDIVLRQSTNTRWVWSQMSKDLSKWEEAMGFYDTV